MNRTRRKARKMFNRRYGKATNPFWVKQTPAAPIDQTRLEEACRAVWARCRCQPQVQDPSESEHEGKR